MSRKWEWEYTVERTDGIGNVFHEWEMWMDKGWMEKWELNYNGCLGVNGRREKMEMKMDQ